MATKKSKKAEAEAKADSYNDTFKGAQTKGMTDALSSTAEYMYMHDPIARKIVDVVPEEMVTPGFGLDGVKDEKAFKSVWDGMNLNEKLICAFAWGELFGGSIIVAIIRDNRALSSPVRPGALLESVRVYDRTKVQIEARETNPRQSRFGEPISYRISPGNSMPEYVVHYTRCHIIDGKRSTEQYRLRNGGWGASVLSPRLIHAINDYNYCEELATQLLRRKQQAVWKAKGLALLCDDNEGEYVARIRLAQVDDNSGVGRAIGIDADDEEYDVLNSDISGVDAFLDKKMDRIVSYSGIHEIILKNKNVGGVSSSQNTALETFYKLVNRRRGEDYRPLLEWLIPFIVTEEEWSIRFEPLSSPSAKEEAETLKLNVESLSSALNSQLIDLDEGRNTLQAMSDKFKIKDGAPDKNAMLNSTEIDPGANDDITPDKAKGAEDEGSQAN
ncbi:putative portal protein [Erwinia phage Snitter]|nr:putative portal protein [Erwinia phage Snitter]